MENVFDDINLLNFIQYEHIELFKDSIVHLRIVQGGRKNVTVATGIPETYNLDDLCKSIKKKILLYRNCQKR